MKFFCDNCSTQYLISDEKIGPKGVKVRCKRCGNVIVVRPPQGESEAAADWPQDAVVTDNEGTPFPPNGDQDESDDVGQAFDQLLQGGLDASDDDDDDGEEQATEIFRMDDVRRDASAGSDEDKIDQVFADAESTGGAPATADESDLDSDWYVAIGDEQVGPMDVGEIESRWESGEISEDSLAWHAGMSDWSAISDIPRLRYLCASGRPQAGERESTEVDAPDQERADGEKVAAAGQEWAPQTSSELSSLVEEEIASVSQPPPQEADSVPPDEPLGDVLGDDGDVPPWEMDDPPSGEVAQPSDSYFDSSLDKGADDGDEAYFNSTYSRSGRVLAGPAYLGAGKKSDSKVKWLLIGVLAVLILGGGTVIAFMFSGGSSDGDGKTVPVAAPDAGVEKAAGAGGEDGGPADGGEAAGVDAGSKDEGAAKDPQTGGDSDKPADKAGDQDEGATDAPREIVVRKPVPKPDATKPRVDKPKDRHPTGNRKKRRRKVAVVTPPPDKPKTVDVKPANDDSSLPKKLSKAQISGTMKKYIKAMRSCVEQQKQRDPSVTGTMQVSFVIQPDGGVKSVTVKTAQHKGTYVAGCISFIIKSMKFPKAQTPFTVPVLPLKLGG